MSWRSDRGKGKSTLPLTPYQGDLHPPSCHLPCRAHEASAALGNASAILPGHKEQPRMECRDGMSPLCRFAAKGPHPRWEGWGRRESTCLQLSLMILIINIHLTHCTHRHANTGYVFGTVRKKNSILLNTLLYCMFFSLTQFLSKMWTGQRPSKASLRSAPCASGSSSVYLGARDQGIPRMHSWGVPHSFCPTTAQGGLGSAGPGSQTHGRG